MVFDADVAVVDMGEADAQLVDGYIERVGWDPRQESGAWSLLVLTLTRGQAWNGPGEIEGRTIIRNGQWLDR